MINNKLAPQQKKDSTIVINADPQASLINAAKDIYVESLHCFTDYLNCREKEITERERISATLTAVIEKINANKEMFVKMIEISFEERKLLYSRVEETIQVATQTNNIEMLKVAYNFMLTVFHGGIDGNTNLIGQTFSNSKIVNYLE